MAVWLLARWRAFAAQTSNRVTVLSAVFWVLYLAAVRPWAHRHNLAFYDVGAFFERIGETVARACGLYAPDLGAVQFLAGIGALMAAVRLSFWALQRGAAGRRSCS